MGLLDDAIREHLELKRRSGADASELARLEHDAFGPIRGVHEEAPPAPAEDDAYDDEPVFADDPAPVSDAAPEPPSAPPAEDPQATVAFSLEELEAAQAGAAPHPEGPGHAPDPDAPVRHGYDDDEAVPVLPDPDEGIVAPEPDIVPPDEEPVELDEDHDELEETPEFLQETPEHDRLWFEQKPPRDFDF